MNSQRMGDERKLPNLLEKKNSLVHILQDMENCVLAFSGGLDSSYLAVMAQKNVRGRLICATILDPTTPNRDMRHARELAEKFGLEHVVIQARLADKVAENPENRCYFCKKEMFQRLAELGREEKITILLDGENASDSQYNRPGRAAADECGVLSPLALAGLAKEEIRMLADAEGIPEPDRPPSACLSSRIPFGVPLDGKTLAVVDQTEESLRQRGIRMVRARVEGDGIRIEMDRDEVTLENLDVLFEMEHWLRTQGWRWVALDLGGYAPAGERIKGGDS